MWLGIQLSVIWLYAGRCSELFIATPNIRRLQRLPKISQWTNSTHLAYNFEFLLMLKPSICQVALLEDIILDKLVSLLRSGTESYIIWRISCTL